MKFDEFYIEFDLKNEEKIVETLESMGFSKKDNYDSGSKFVSTYGSGRFRKIDRNLFSHQPLYTFEQFMQKYGSNTMSNKMIETINKAKKELQFNNAQLSLAIGKSRQYITKMLNLPQSEKIQDKVIKEIDALLAREKFNPLSILSKPSEHRIDELNELSDIAKNSYNRSVIVEDPENSINEISVLRFQNNCKDKDIAQLKKKNESLIASNSGLINQLDRAEKVHNEDTKALQEAHSIIHIKNQRIDELESSEKVKDEDNTKLLNGLLNWKDECGHLSDKILRERIILIIIIAILLAVMFFK